MEASAARGPAAAPAQRSPRLLRVASDERLVELVRTGSQSAFEVVYDRHHRGILAFCRHMLGSREEAEDAVQHTFMAAYRDLVGSTKDIQLRAWLYAIARNRCLSVLRARRERPSDDLDEPVTEGLAAAVERKQELKDLLRDLAALPEDQRAALVLSELGALPHDEIAAVLDCPKDKVKALVFQARSSLHASRDARETDCSEIRELLSNLRGGSLRRTTLRRHLRDCSGCRAFRDEVARQRKAMAVVLPVLPTLGLKDSALAAAFGTKGVGAAGAVGVAATAGGAGSAATGAVAGGGAPLIAKVAVIAALAGGATAGGVAGVNAIDGGASGGGTPASERAPDPAPAAAADDDDGTHPADEAARPAKREARKRARGRDDRGREFAKTRGKGKKRGLNGTQPGKAGDEEKLTGRERAAQRKAQAQQRQLARKQRAKNKAKSKQKAQRPARTPRPEPTPKPRPAPTPRPERTPRPEPTPEPTPAATVEAAPAPTEEAPKGKE